MKRIIALLLSAAAIGSAFAGCGEAAKDAGSAVSQMASDAVNGAGKVVNDAGNGVSNMMDSTTAPSTAAATENTLNTADTVIDENSNDGEISDGDGLIGNEDSGVVEDNTDNAGGDEDNTDIADAVM